MTCPPTGDNMKIQDVTHEQIVTNITQVYTCAVDCNRTEAGDWYRNAHDQCRIIATSLEMPLDTFLGVVAALSPQMNWKYNIREAVRLVHGMRCLGYGRNIAKAKRILLNGEQPLDVLGGNKVRAFYCNLRDGGANDQHVTIDTWALRIALGKDGYTQKISGITDKQYKRLVKAYQQVAAEFGILATELQAITWVHVRVMVNERITAAQIGLGI